MLSAPGELHDRFLIEGVEVVRITCRECGDRVTVPASRVDGALRHRCQRAA